LVGDHRDAVADRIERVEVVRDQEDGEAEPVAQVEHEPVEGGRADRIEAGGRLVQEEQLGIERERAGDSGALAHSARQLGGEFGAGFGRQADHDDLVGRDLVEQLLREARIEFAKRHLHVLGDGQGREERGALEQDSPALADRLQRGIVAVEHRLAEHPHLALVGLLQADDRAHQHRLAGSRAADHAEYLALAHVEVEALVDDLLAEAVAEALHLDDGGALLAHSQPISVKKTAKKASRTMTRKIAWTTAVVVLRPTSSASDLTCMPW
jgi:hypothetical protein